MTESRQQRRARERSEAKAATRATTVPQSISAPSISAPSTVRPTRTYAVEVFHEEFDEGGEDDGVWWGAEGGLENDLTGIDFESREDLAGLVDEIVEEARSSWGDRFDLRLEWRLIGSPISLRDAAAEAGFTLPDRV